mgnify:CR=1 FL=1
MGHDLSARLEIILAFAATFFIPVHVSFFDLIFPFNFVRKQWVDSSISFGDMAMASFRFSLFSFL